MTGVRDELVIDISFFRYLASVGRHVLHTVLYTEELSILVLISQPNGQLERWNWGWYRV